MSATARTTSRPRRVMRRPGAESARCADPWLTCALAPRLEAVDETTGRVLGRKPGRAGAAYEGAAKVAAMGTLLVSSPPARVIPFERLYDRTYVPMTPSVTRHAVWESNRCLKLPRGRATVSVMEEGSQGGLTASPVPTGSTARTTDDAHH